MRKNLKGRDSKKPRVSCFVIRDPKTFKTRWTQLKVALPENSRGPGRNRGSGLEKAVSRKKAVSRVSCFMKNLIGSDSGADWRGEGSNELLEELLKVLTGIETRSTHHFIARRYERPPTWGLPGACRPGENGIGEQLHPRGSGGSLPTMGSHSCRRAVIGSTRVARLAGR